MARTDYYRDVTRHCVMCGKDIPAERKWDAVTCSPECTKARKNYGRSRRDQNFCRYCNRPSTPEERTLFAMWKKWERSNAGNEEFAAQLLDITRLVRENERLKRRLAEVEAGTVPNDGNLPQKDEL